MAVSGVSPLKLNLVVYDRHLITPNELNLLNALLLARETASVQPGF